MKTAVTATLALTLALSIASIGSIGDVYAASYTAPTDESQQDFHIDREGNIGIRQAKIIQISGTTIYVRYYVGLAFIRVLVKTTPATKIHRKYGDEIDLDQIIAGDILNIDGKVESGADSLSIIATKLVDFSNQKEISNFKGTVVGTGTVPGSLMLSTSGNTITVLTGTTTQIRKGNRIIGADLVKNGDTVTDVVGTYDHATKTIVANVVVVYTNMKVFTPRNFEGTLKSISGNNPITLLVNTEGKDYTVILTDKTTILNKAKRAVSMKRYLEGDTVRLYGAIREAEDPIIDAEVVRNISLQ